MTNEQPKAILLKDYRPYPYRIESVALDFDLDAERTRVKARLSVRSDHDRQQRVEPLVLDGDGLRLVSLALDGRPLEDGDYLLNASHLTLPKPPETFVLAIETEIRPSENTRLEGLYVSNDTFCTQCEAEGFRRITFFPDRPDVLSVYTTTIRAAEGSHPVLLSNGNAVARGALEDGRHFVTWEDPFPKPSYLFALVAGDLARVEDSFTTMSGREVALNIYVEHGNESRCAYAMDALKRAMRWDEERFGLEYDLDVFNIVAVSDFNMGAMENKSLNIFNAKYILADPETATDEDYAHIEAVVAHEYFHNWTGNRVTCRDWFQLSLKEGLTVFRDQEFSADMRSAPVKRIQDVRALRARQFPEDAGPLAHPVRPDSYIEINNFYTATVYEKGAEVIRMLQTLLGRAGFTKGLQLYLRRHDGQAATCDDFIRAMADANDVDLAQFKLWYSQAGTPEVRVSSRYLADEAVYELEMTQTCPTTPGQPDKRPMLIPLSLGLLDTDGRDVLVRLEGEPPEMAAKERVLRLTGSRQSFRFADVATPPIPSVNRSFSAPIVLKAGYSNPDRAFLMANDSDTFNRWEAGQQFAVTLLLEAVAAIRRGETSQADATFIAAVGKSLEDSNLDRAYLAQTLMLPSEDYLAEQMEIVDVEAIHAARQAMRKAIAHALQEPLLAAYHANQDRGPYNPDAGSAGRRALKNAALGYLAASDDAELSALVAGQYGRADNMTDRMAALRLLVDMDIAARAEALADFHHRFAHDAVTIDKWFAVQAMSSRPDTLDNVRRLMQDSAFNFRNPNKLRALIGSFASANPLRFHAADGSGYQFLADQVLAVDSFNPQVAARLLAPLGRWRRFDAARQQRMRGELTRIVATSGLSRDVYEIASKSLG